MAIKLIEASGFIFIYILNCHAAFQTCLLSRRAVLYINYYYPIYGRYGAYYRPEE